MSNEVSHEVSNKVKGGMIISLQGSGSRKPDLRERASIHEVKRTVERWGLWSSPNVSLSHGKEFGPSWPLQF